MYGERMRKLFVAACRGRNPDNPKSRESGLPTKQMLEINYSNICNAITTVQKDNYVLIFDDNTERINL